MTEINTRQSLVAFFHARPFLQQDLAQHLLNAEDASRITQKLILRRGTSSDLTAICATIDTWISIKERVLMEKQMDASNGIPADETAWSSIEALMERLSDLEGLAHRIRSSLVAREAAVTQDEELVEEQSAALAPPTAIRDSKNPLGLAEWTIKPG